MNNLTILIPSIGRDSLFKSVENLLPLDCKIHILATGQVGEEFWTKYDKLSEVAPERITCSYLEQRLNAGLAKQYLIDQVDTDLFMVLDDDDTLLIEHLKLGVRIMNTSECNWVCHKGGHEEKGSLLAAVNNLEQLESSLFEYDKWDPKYEMSHLYPTSACIVRTEKFKGLNNHYTLPYGDDIVPITDYMINYPNGVFFMTPSLIYQSTEDSVSRKYRKPEELDVLLVDLASKMMNSIDKREYRIWMRCLDNMIKRVKHINSKFDEQNE